MRIAVAGLLDVRKCCGKRDIISAVGILVVDDELAIRKGLAAMLEGAGYSVRTARDGIAALGAIRARRSDLVLLDVMMPLMDGFAVCERIRQFDRDLPIVFPPFLSFSSIVLSWKIGSQKF